MIFVQSISSDVSTGASNEFKYEFEYEDESSDDENGSAHTADNEHAKSHGMLKKKKSGRKNETNESESSRIAKSMFTETKLSMTAFETIDIGKIFLNYVLSFHRSGITLDLLHFDCVDLSFYA